MAIFGNTTRETDRTITPTGSIRGAGYACGEVGTADSIAAYMDMYDSGVKSKAALYKKSDASLVGTSNENTGDGVTGWRTWLFSVPKPSLVATDYVLCLWSDGAAGTFGVASKDLTTYRYYKIQVYNNYPNPFNGTTGNSLNYHLSIYCNYTPAGGLSIPVAMHHYGHHISKIIRG